MIFFAVDKVWADSLHYLLQIMYNFQSQIAEHLGLKFYLIRNFR